MVNPVGRRRFGRRVLIGGVAATLAGGGLLAGCGGNGEQSKARERQKKGSAEKVGGLEGLVPKHVAWDGLPEFPAADVLPGKTSDRNGLTSPDGLLRYPSQLVRAVADAPGAGGTYTSITPLWSPPPASKNDYYQAIADRIGTTIKFNPSDGNEYQDKLTAILGASDHPDITMIPRWNLGIPRIEEAIANLFTDLTPFLKGDIADRWPLLANLPTNAWTECIWDGKLMALPQVEGLPYANPLFYRKDIFDALGVSEPTDAESLFELGQEVTDQKENRWAFGGIEASINEMFGVPDQSWRVESDGSLVNAIETEERKLALEFLRRLFDAKLIHPNWGAESADEKQLFRSGEILMRYDGWGDWAEALAAVAEDNPDYNQQPMPAFAHDGGDPVLYGTDPAWGFTFLHKDLKKDQIEEILDVANWLAAPFGTEEYEMLQYGLEDVHYERDDEGRPELNDQGQAETGSPIPTYYFISGRPPEPFDGDNVESRVEWGNAHVDFVGERPFAGLKVEEPTALKQANQWLVDVTDDLIRGRRPLSDLEKVASEWRDRGGEQGREFYAKALEARDK